MGGGSLVVGPVTTDEATGAYPNGSRIRKTWCEEGDAHEIGARATITGSIGPMAHPTTGEVMYGYFLCWDDMPGIDAFTIGPKIELIEKEN